MNKKGFGKITSVKNIEYFKNPSTSKIIEDNQKSMEEKIQNNIDKLVGLREAMNLSKDLINIESNNLAEVMLNMYTEKEGRLQELYNSYGWNKATVHNKLQEITWDASAIERNERHLTEKVSDSMNEFMTMLAKKCLQLQSSGHILDVGCGTGVIYSYMKKIQKEKEKSKSRSSSNSSKSTYQEDKCVGIDLSSEMINIAKKASPTASFYQSDLMDFTYKHPFNVIVFNECLHYLVDQKEALKHAISLCNIPTTTTATTASSISTAKTSTIIISHPKGYKHVQKLHAINRLMVPSILPTKTQLEQMIQSIQYELEHVGCTISNTHPTSSRPCPNITIELPPMDDSAHYLAILKVTYEDRLDG